MPLPLRCLFSVLVLAAAAAVAQVPAAVDAAFGRGGDNRGELEAAWQRVPEDQRTSLAFLLEHMPDADARTLTASFLLQQVDLAHAARRQVPWGKELPEALFLGFVLPYAQANERREDWRSDFVRRFLPTVLECRTPGEAALRLNATIFDALGVHYSTGRSRADQAPSAAIAEGKASCTGLSILLADACRACCVPARLVSVRWPHKAGNHTWVEVWDGAAWRFVGADEPDPAGFDRAWFVADAAQSAKAPREHRLWAVSFAATGERFGAGWGRGVELWGEDVSARYAATAWSDGRGGTIPTVLPWQQDPAAAALAAQLDRFFAAASPNFEFDRNLDEELRTRQGDARLRGLVFEAWKRSERAALAADHEAQRVRAGDKESAFTVKQVGEKPASGWPLVIAMHGGGGVPKRVNDSQWRHMQVYYEDQPAVGGYLYCALRAPTDEWNGFYTDYFYPVIEKLIRQFVVCDDVDPDRVVAIGYSHGGYGAFAVGPKLPHRFAAVHASAAAPTDGESVPTGLHTLAFSFLVGGKDTAYGRRERCEAFAAAVKALQEAHPGQYPVTFTLALDHGHTGLPDRGLLAELVPKVRVATPPVLRWEPTDAVVKDHYWLCLAAAARGQRLEARLEAGRLVLHAPDVEGVTAWLDARLVDLTQPLVVRTGAVERTVTPQPSLRVLCETMRRRGDRELAASWIVALQ